MQQHDKSYANEVELSPSKCEFAHDKVHCMLNSFKILLTTIKNESHMSLNCLKIFKYNNNNVMENVLTLSFLPF